MAETTPVPEWDLGDRMRKALRHSGLSVQEMADYLDVSTASLRAWTNGRTTPRTQTLRLWALRCGVDYQWLTTGWPSTLPWTPDEARAWLRSVNETGGSATLDDLADLFVRAPALMGPMLSGAELAKTQGAVGSSHGVPARKPALLRPAA